MDWLEILFFSLLSLLLQWIAGLRERWIIVIVVGLLILAYGFAHLLQRRLVLYLKKNPAATAPLGRLEANLSILAPVAWAYAMLEGTAKVAYGWLRRKDKKEKNKQEKKDRVSPTESYPLLVATLGPTFFLAGVLTGVTYWLAWVTEPLFARSFNVRPGLSFWQHLLLGQRPEFGWLLPLEDRPLLAVVLCLVFWLAVWWSYGNILRGLVYRSDLQRNLHIERETALPLWTSGFGVIDLEKPGRSYQWANWLVAVAAVLIVGAWTTLDREQDGISPSALAMGLVVPLSWLVHLHLRGFARRPEAGEAKAKSPEETPPGWPQVIEELGRLHGLQAPKAQFERPLSALQLETDMREVAAFSPLTAELLLETGESPESAQEPRLTAMQHKVLESLSLLGFVHLPPPRDDDALILPSSGPEGIEDRSGLSERHQIVLAPEGAGKTTLAMLAAANHALVHARATLIITRSEAQARETFDRIRSAIEPSTVRWNLRLRRVGRDFASDLSQDIIPDIVVASLHQTATNLLDNSEVYAPFLRTVGLVVVDDVESFVGPVEIHAQLAFRRLHLLFRQLANVDQLGPENVPVMLVLGVDAMKETATWVKSLCGIRAAVRQFAESRATDGDEETQAPHGVRQMGFRLRDLRTESGRELTVAEIVAACESYGVPWSYRPCGDGRRHLGRGPLLLQTEPEYDCNSPRDACVFFLEGHWSEVRRELRRLPWAGNESGRDEIVFLTAVEREEEAACEALQPSFGLDRERSGEEISDLAAELATLPLPIVRPPSSLAVQSHLLSDLLQHWIEVKDLVDTFEAPVAHCLRRLKAEGMLLTEERKDVLPELKEYESKVYARALATSVDVEQSGSLTEGVTEYSLYDKVRQVELVSSTAVAVRNRSEHTVLRYVEADSAGLIYYPGRVFEDSRGRFVVVGRAHEGHRFGAIEVEPVLHDDLSAPRRRFDIAELPKESAPYPLFPPELVLLGRDPVTIGLVSVRAKIRPLATYRLDRVTGEIQSRELHGNAICEAFQPRPLTTVALVMRPNPQEAPPGSPPLRFGEARLLAMLLRVLLPLLYRDTREHAEVALRIEEAEQERRDSIEIHGSSSTNGDSKYSSPRWDIPLGPHDTLYILDLHQGGNGIARALYREGLELPLRFCRHFLEQSNDFRRLQRLYDHWGDLEEILAEGHPEKPTKAGATEPLKDLLEEISTTPASSLDAEADALPEEATGVEEAATEPVDLEKQRAAEDTVVTASLDVEEPASVDVENTETADAARDKEPAAGPLPLGEIRRGLLEWLDSRLHPEPFFEEAKARESETPENEQEAA